MENSLIKIKYLLDCLSAIKTPLVLWGFFGLLMYLAFKTFSKNNTWFRELSKNIVDRLSQTGLYKTVRLFFITLIVLICLAFAAPVINNLIDQYFNKDVLEGKIEDVKKK